MKLLSIRLPGCRSQGAWLVLVPCCGGRAVESVCVTSLPRAGRAQPTLLRTPGAFRELFQSQDWRGSGSGFTGMAQVVMNLAWLGRLVDRLNVLRILGNDDVD